MNERDKYKNKYNKDFLKTETDVLYQDLRNLFRHAIRLLAEALDRRQGKIKPKSSTCLHNINLPHFSRKSMLPPCVITLSLVSKFSFFIVYMS